MRTAHLKLRGLDQDARYVVAALEDKAKARTLEGRELMESGLPVHMTGPATVQNLVYRKAP
jgi:hypothetical protein